MNRQATMAVLSRKAAWMCVRIAACILGMLAAQFLTTQLLRRAPRTIAYVRVDPSETSRIARERAQEFQEAVTRDAEEGKVGQPANRAHTAVEELSAWLPRSRRVEASFQGSQPPSVLVRSEWAASNLEPPLSLKLPEAELAKLRRRHAVLRSLHEEKLSLLDGLPEPPWKATRYQLLATTSVKPPVLSVGRDFAPHAGPELTLAWFELELGTEASGFVRDLALDCIRLAEIQRRTLVVEILNAIRERATAVEPSRQKSTVYIAEGLLHLFKPGDSRDIDEILDSIVELRDTTLLKLRELRN